MFTIKQLRTPRFLLLVISSLLLAFVAQFALPAHADCFYEGEKYLTGDVLGPYVCMPDGTWQPQ